ncbi:unnamed protein product [Schistosoma curassoni]|uniref:Uncharacterized protein n=1 Tax=Schistosoma curassoni TaxID=6186 RepID=A0A183KNX6_9TREM|nr:unnamed protein product [Schistosoma curassoni]
MRIKPLDKICRPSSVLLAPFVIGQRSRKLSFPNNSKTIG